MDTADWRVARDLLTLEEGRSLDIEKIIARYRDLQSRQNNLNSSERGELRDLALIINKSGESGATRNNSSLIDKGENL